MGEPRGGDFLDVRHRFLRRCDDYPHPRGLDVYDCDGDTVTVPEPECQPHWPAAYRAALAGLVEAAGQLAQLLPELTPEGPTTPEWRLFEASYKQRAADLRAALDRIRETQP